MIRAVLLDALGTLVELPAPWPALVEELAARGVAIDEEQAHAALLEEMAYYRAHHDTAVDTAALDALRDRCTEVLRAALPGHARSAGDLRGALLGALRFRPYPEVPGVLTALGELGVGRIVVSNWDVSLRAVLEEVGLAPLLDATIISAEVGAAKPDPRIFALALARAGARPHEALHVGDTIEADIAGARAAGIRAVHLDRSGTEPGALASLDGLLDLLRSLEP